jgi:chorismate mutase/prephenate dehydrogenase
MSADTSPGEPIAELRERLDSLDARILELVAERQELVTRIGEQKHCEGKALRDYVREREVIDRGMRRAERLGMPGHIARDILERLIFHSLSNQEQRQLVSSRHGAGLRALVIGGLGRMGDWLARYFDALGYTVEIADPGTGESLFPVVADWRDSGLDHDVIAIAAPLRASNAILKELAAHRPAGLVFDIGSLKGPLGEGLAAMREAGCRITSVHPMFGPGELMLSGRHILFVDAGHRAATREALALFAHTAADCVELRLDDHDEVMAWVLGLSHLVNIAFATALRRSGEAVPLLKRISSTTFNEQLRVASQVVSENPHLYFEIQQGTATSVNAVQAFTGALEELVRSIGAGEEQAFAEMMTRAFEHLAGNGEEPK